jgi:flavin prenyltransferase
MKHIILAITGASGAPLGLRLLQILLSNEDVQVSLIISKDAKTVIGHETDWDCGQSHEESLLALDARFGSCPRLRFFDASDMAARISSGSSPSHTMIIAPCSMSTLGAITHGITMNLIHRAASVMLKEKRALILIPRESPLSPIHLENMLRLSRIGVHIVPATLAFYTKPKSVDDLVDFTCARVLDLAGISHHVSRRWMGRLEDSKH